MGPALGAELETRLQRIIMLTEAHATVARSPGEAPKDTADGGTQRTSSREPGKERKDEPR